MSIVNHTYKYIFCHEPHTGGRSIEKALMTHEGSSNFNGEHHILPTDMVGKGFVTEKQIKEYKRVCVIRDPHDLLLTYWSLYNKQKDAFADWVTTDGVGLMREGTLFWRYAEFCPWHIFHECGLQEALNTTLTSLCGTPPVKLPVIGKTADKPDWRDVVTINLAEQLEELYPDIRKYSYAVL